MSVLERYSEYDNFAWFYNQYWGNQYHKMTFGILDRMLFQRIPPGAPILDLCCGTGHLTRALVSHGYEVTGIDGSEEMLRYARANVPSASFMLADARNFTLEYSVGAVISTFESLNHVMSIEELGLVFRNVHKALADNGLFIFDIITEEAYQTQWHKSSGIIGENDACILKGSYDPDNRLGRTDITMFRLEEEWKRSDITLFQRCYSPEEIQSGLEQCGFTEITLHHAGNDLGMDGELGVGRIFFVAVKG